MPRYRKILVAIDGSEASMHALRESFRFACTEKCWITVVSVAPPYEGDLSLTAIGDIHHALKEPSEKALQAAETLARKHGALVKTVFEQGDPHERIVDLAEADNCDIIIVGRTGRGGLQRALIGSVTARVIGYSQKDVLVVPPEATIGWQKIMLATDGSKYSSAAAERAIDFAVSYNGSLIATSVVDVPAEIFGEASDVVDGMVTRAKTLVDDLCRTAAGKGIQAEGIVREGDAAAAIIKVSEEKKADMIVIGSHGRTGLKRLLMGSVAEKVIGYAPCPVLVVR